jgi:phosphonate transport system substrate-binding protein
MEKLSCRLAAVLGLLLVFSVMIVPPWCQAHEPLNPNVIKFGVFPYQSPKTIVEMYGPLAARLEEKLGKKITISSAPDVKIFFDKARDGEYDLLLLPPTVYYKLRSAGYKVIARGASTFYGGAIVRKDSDVKTIEQLKGKKVAAIGEHSYAGYIFILPQLKAKGIDPHQDVDIQFLGKVDTVIYGVINKKYDAGLLRLDTLDLPAFAGVRDQVTVITRSPEIPQFPFVVKNSMDKATITAIQETVTALSPDSAQELEILKSMQVEKIVAATDADYEGFYEQTKDTDYFRQP